MDISFEPIREWGDNIWGCGIEIAKGGICYNFTGVFDINDGKDWMTYLVNSIRRAEYMTTDEYKQKHNLVVAGWHRQVREYNEGLVL